MIDIPPTKVCILIATYNSQDLILRTLKSLHCSSQISLNLIISDDGSRDQTRAILDQFATDTSHSIQILERPDLRANNLVENFGYLCTQALKTSADLYFFCDHDDVWHANKIDSLVRRFRTDEAKFGKNPWLLYSDARVVDGSLRTISESFFRYQGLYYPEKFNLNSNLHCNVAPGCTMAFNYKMLDLATPLPKRVVIHDHWVYLLAKAAGSITLVDESLIDYVQHSGNAIGARKANRWYEIRLRDFLQLVALPSALTQYCDQTSELIRRIEERGYSVAPSSHEEITRFSMLPRMWALKRIWFGLRYFRHCAIFVRITVIPIILLMTHKN